MPIPIPDVRVRYRTFEFGEVDIHVRTLRDRQQFADPDGEAARLGISSSAWPHFGVVWDASQVLAGLMAEHEVEGKRILEVGCGIALASLVLNKRSANITATDHHPEVEEFLRINAELNHGPRIPFVRTGWEDEPHEDLGVFDLVIGSDLLYEDHHARELSGFIDRHAAGSCEVILVDPGRGHHAKLSKRMVRLGYSHSQSRSPSPEDLSKPFTGQVLSYRR